MRDKRTLVQSIIAYIFHAVFLVLTFIMMPENTWAIICAGFFGGLAYWILMIISNRKTHMPWLAYVNFLIGGAVHIGLNLLHIVPRDNSGNPGLGQNVYCGVMIAVVVAVGVTNLMMQAFEEAHKK